MADSNSLTLADYALMSNSPQVQKISTSMLMFGNVLQDIPLTDYNSMIATGVRFIGTSGNATPGWRQINEAPAVTKGVPKPWSEQAYILSNNFAIDNVLLQDRNSIQDPWSVQLNHYLEMVTYDINDKFINNDHITGDKDAPVGLRYRLDNPTQFDIPSELKINAGGVDISGGLNGPKLLYYVDKALDFLGAPDGNGVVLYCDEELRRLMSFAIKTAGTSGGFEIVKDSFDRRVMMYRGATLRTIGRKADQTTHIITTTESAAGANASSTFTSLYAVRYGDGYFRGWQFRPLEQAVIGPYLLTATGTQQQLTLDWPVGLMQEHTRSIARIYDIKVA